MNERVYFLKERVFDIIDDQDEGEKPNRLFDYLIIGIIILNVAIIFLETYESIYLTYFNYFRIIELFTIFVFTIEYFMRIWTCTIYPTYSHPIYGRLRYMVSMPMIIDFLATFPFYIALMFPLDPRIINYLRLFRLFRILKILRYYGTMGVIFNVVKKNFEYLISVFFILIVFLTFTSYAIYIFESGSQPDVIQDWDDAFWWAIVTTTTVGYGDVYPITLLGKLFTAFVLLLGIGVIALPTGILASGFLEEMKLRKKLEIPSNDVSIVEEIQKLVYLKEKGHISEEEFILIKEKILKKLATESVRQ